MLVCAEFQQMLSTLDCAESNKCCPCWFVQNLTAVMRWFVQNLTDVTHWFEQNLTDVTCWFMQNVTDVVLVMFVRNLTDVRVGLCRI